MSDPTRPEGRPSMTFRWLELLFLHWPVPAAALRSLVPDPLEIETHEGNAWVGLVPFTMRDVRHTHWPPVPTMHHFHECNVRTYVTHQGVRGVYFFSLDAVSWLAVRGAQLLWNLNYRHARIDLDVTDGTTTYAVRRRSSPPIRMRAQWRTGPRRALSEPGSLDHFLTERYSMFACDRRGRPWCGRIWHDRWTLHDAELVELDDELVAAAGIDVGGPPIHVRAAGPVFAEAWAMKQTVDRSAVAAMC